jgi:hypothetical protein
LPALPVVPKVIKTDLVGSYGGDTDVVNRFYLQYTGTAPTAGDLDTIANAIGASWDSNIASVCSETAVALSAVTMTDLSTVTSPSVEQPAVFPGTRTGAELPADACFVTGYEITRRYRGGHPRGYWPFGVAADLATAQTWDSGFITAAVDAVAGFFGTIPGLVWTGGGVLSQVSVSYYEGFTAVENPITHRYRNVPNVRVTPLIDAVADIVGRPRVGSQRRRLGKS